MAVALSGLLGTKVGMTRVFDKDGTVTPVTVVKAGPCFVTQIKTPDKDGYGAVQVGFRAVKESRATKPMLGHFKKSGGRAFRHLKEFKVGAVDGFQLGQEITVGIFAKGDKVGVSGVTKGQGFQGVVRRHGHAGGKDSHGSMFHRQPGSAGSGTDPGRVLKGRKFPGHMGAVQATIKGLEVVEVMESDQLLLIKGALPGPPNGILVIMKAS